MIRFSVHNRDVPDGWELAEWLTDNWRIGWVFQWSEHYQTWYELPGDNRLTIKPGVYLTEALQSWLDGWHVHNINNEYDVFQPTPEPSP